VAEHSTHYPEIEGSNPGADNRRGKIAKKAKPTNQQAKKLWLQAQNSL
jgi:hypothetical protein